MRKLFKKKFVELFLINGQQLTHLYPRQEAISEEPNLGSPVAEYELEAEAMEAEAAALREKEEERESRLAKFMPAPTPDKGILMSPNYR